MRLFDRPLQIIRLLRVQNWFYLLGIAGLAVARSSARNDFSNVGAVFFFAALYLCWGYVFNNLFDLEEDSELKNPFKALSAQTPVQVATGLTIVLVFVGWFYGLLIPTLTIVALNCLYSIPPIRLKQFLIPSLVCNGFFFSFVYFLASRILNGDVSRSELVVSLFVFSMFLPIQYVHFLEHRESEKKKNGLSHKLAVIGFQTPLCLASCLLNTSYFNPVFFATLLYSILFLAVVLYGGLAASARNRVRWLSAGFGVYLLSQFWIG